MKAKEEAKQKEAEEKEAERRKKGVITGGLSGRVHCSCCAGRVGSPCACACRRGGDRCCQAGGEGC